MDVASLTADSSNRESGFVGVDVVDTRRHRGSSRAGDQRFLDRVFTAAEQERIRSAVEPETELWIHWAAKEAAFKVMSKVLGAPPVFRHRAFEVSGQPGEVVSWVRFEAHEMGLSVQAHADRIMVHAWDDLSSLVLVSHLTLDRATTLLGLRGPLQDWQGSRFSREELASVHGVPSALVRLLARREAALAMGLAEERLSIVCASGPAGLSPPFLHLDGAPASGVDVSLSHDGRHLAWALRLPWSS